MRIQSMENSKYNWKAISRSLFIGNQELAAAVRVLHGFDVEDIEAKIRTEMNKAKDEGKLTSEEASVKIAETMKAATANHGRLLVKARTLLASF